MQMERFRDSSIQLMIWENNSERYNPVREKIASSLKRKLTKMLSAEEFKELTEKKIVDLKPI